LQHDHLELELRALPQHAGVQPCSQEYARKPKTFRGFGAVARSCVRSSPDTSGRKRTVVGMRKLSALDRMNGHSVCSRSSGNADLFR
jgi:hypothetical protein